MQKVIPFWLLLVTIPVLSVTVGCGKEEQGVLTAKSVAYGESLEDAVEQFEATRKSVADNVDVTTKSAGNSLDDSDADLKGVASEWEVNWENVKTRVGELEETLSTVGGCSVEYFDELEELASRISNPDLQVSEMQKNAALKEKWTRVFDEATKYVKELQAVVVKGDDVHFALLGAALRQKIEVNIKQVRTISKEANAILKELKTLTDEGRRLIGNT